MTGPLAEGLDPVAAFAPAPVAPAPALGVSANSSANTSESTSAAARGRRVAFFGHDRAEPTVRKRIDAIREAGWSVIVYAFERDRPGGVPAEAPVADDIVPLGLTVDRNYARRLPRLAVGIVRALRRRRDLRAADVIYVRNLDMALVAWTSARLAGSRARLIYEVLDIQRLMVRPDAPGRVARAIERWLLGRSDLLVVSAPDFIDRYFRPVQGFAGAWHLLENKVMGHRLGEVATRLDRTRTAEPPWVIGWFGTLRCRRSLTILAAIADALGDLGADRPGRAPLRGGHLTAHPGGHAGRPREHVVPRPLRESPRSSGDLQRDPLQLGGRLPR
ncbi:hypothetical protein ACU4GA_12260 [Methylobacterium oryzae CBMB20]